MLHIKYLAHYVPISIYIVFYLELEHIFWVIFILNYSMFSYNIAIWLYSSFINICTDNIVIIALLSRSCTTILLYLSTERKWYHYWVTVLWKHYKYPLKSLQRKAHSTQ